MPLSPSFYWLTSILDDSVYQHITPTYGCLSHDLVLYVSPLLRAFVMEFKVYLDNSRTILFHLEMFNSSTSALTREYTWDPSIGSSEF